ncbi:hypothetical protein BLNAU_24404 [Blattamonas nauphoetae]|uniref:Uncharacterized protein n=1 Tax=Blattamonas nauphoetae TaxID=2049346 RepID=A0ABQ9WMK0_9EUKA|nr:hypothetical protein BLNAU_24404 [Blattamonas nauphoetae]
MPTTTLPMFLEALPMIRINTNRLSQFLYLPEMEEVVETAETRLTDPANALKITNGEFKCGSAPAIPLTQAEETALKKKAEQRKKEAKLAAAKETQVNPQSNEMQETEVSPQEPQSNRAIPQIFQSSVNVNETEIESNVQHKVHWEL